jgi:hypothetical protein
LHRQNFGRVVWHACFRMRKRRLFVAVNR